MPNPVARCANRLAELIAFRTQNPGGDEPAMCAHLAGLLRSLGPDELDLVEVARPGQQGGYVYARWGTPVTVVNIHVDTVPANSGWTSDPWTSQITDTRVIGLGAADTKGAIAALLVALESRRPKNVGVLLSGDEERGSTCMSAFIDAGHAAHIRRAIVCEPTARTVGVSHRGVRAYSASYRGAGGHSSRADQLAKPIVTLARLAVALDELAVSSLGVGPPGMQGLCMNVASLEGGVAFNVVPDQATLRWSVRPPPGLDVAALDDQIAQLLRRVDPSIELSRHIAHPAFSCPDPTELLALLGPAAGRPVSLDFWTEAALWAQAGVDAVVVGPGDIAQAHAADEFVTLDDLAWATELFINALGPAPGAS